MVDGVSLSFRKLLRFLKIKKKAFYKPIAFSYAIIIFSLTQVCFQKEVHFWVHGIVPLFPIIVRKLSAYTLLSFSPFSSEKRLLALLFLSDQRITQKISFVNSFSVKILFLFIINIQILNEKNGSIVCLNRQNVYCKKSNSGDRMNRYKKL